MIGKKENDRSLRKRDKRESSSIVDIRAEEKSEPRRCSAGRGCVAEICVSWISEQCSCNGLNKSEKVLKSGCQRNGRRVWVKAGSQ